MDKDVELTAVEEMKMRAWVEKLERMAAAAAFAEVGEWQTARSIVEETDKRLTSRDIERRNQSKTRLRERSYHA